MPRFTEDGRDHLWLVIRLEVEDCDGVFLSGGGSVGVCVGVCVWLIEVEPWMIERRESDESRSYQESPNNNNKVQKYMSLYRSVRRRQFRQVQARALATTSTHRALGVVAPRRCHTNANGNANANAIGAGHSANRQRGERPPSSFTNRSGCWWRSHRSVPHEIPVTLATSLEAAGPC